MALLGVKGEKISYTSDYFDQLNMYCVKMIKDGNAYADDTDQETVRSFPFLSLPSLFLLSDHFLLYTNLMCRTYR